MGYIVFDIFKAGVELFNQVNESRCSPFGLEGELLLFFRDLKKSIDTKNIRRLQTLISDNYYSQSFTNTDKYQLLAYFESIFNRMPFFTYPSLEIEICNTPEVKERKVSLVIKPTLNIQTLGFTLMSTPFGTEDRVAFLVEKDDKFGIFSILNMENVY